MNLFYDIQTRLPCLSFSHEEIEALDTDESRDMLEDWFKLYTGVNWCSVYDPYATDIFGSELPLSTSSSGVSFPDLDVLIQFKLTWCV